MCLMDILEYIYRICCILRINRLAAVISCIYEFRLLAFLLYLACFIICYSIALYYHAFKVALLLVVFGVLIALLPVLFSCLQCAIDERKTQGVESQTIRAGFLNIDPDPEAPLLPEAQQRSIISTPESGALWNTEPLRQQPALRNEDVQDIIYKNMKTTCRPRPQTVIPQSSKKEEKQFPTLGSQIGSLPRLRTRSSIALDNQQPGTSQENPCVVRNIPDIQYDPPTDTSESSEVADEDGQDLHLLSVLPYTTTKWIRQTRQSLRLQTVESSINTQSPSKDYNDRQFSRIKKRIGIVDAVTETKQTSERSEKSPADHIMNVENSSQVQISSSEHGSSGTEGRSPSRSSDTATTETTLTDRSDESPSSSRHSSPGDGKRSPKLKDTPTLHKSRSRKNS